MNIQDLCFLNSRFHRFEASNKQNVELSLGRRSEIFLRHAYSHRDLTLTESLNQTIFDESEYRSILR